MSDISGSFKNMSATAVINAGRTRLRGFYVNSTSSGTLVLRDGGASGTVVTGTITPAVGWHFFPLEGSDLHATIGGTLNVTFLFG